MTRRVWVRGEKDEFGYPIGVLNHGPIFWESDYGAAYNIVAALNDFENYLSSTEQSEPDRTVCEHGTPINWECSACFNDVKHVARQEDMRVEIPLLPDPYPGSHIESEA